MSGVGVVSGYNHYDKIQVVIESNNYCSVSVEVTKFTTDGIIWHLNVMHS